MACWEFFVLALNEKLYNDIGHYNENKRNSNSGKNYLSEILIWDQSKKDTTDWDS